LVQQGLQKYSKIGIFGMETNHLANLYVGPPVPHAMNFLSQVEKIRSKDLGPSKTELKRSSKRRPGLSWVVQLLKVFFTSYANGLRSYMSCGNFVPPLSLEVLVTFFFSGEIEI
jgi:hypothetical protein